MCLPCWPWVDILLEDKPKKKDKGIVVWDPVSRSTVKLTNVAVSHCLLHQFSLPLSYFVVIFLEMFNFPSFQVKRHSPSIPSADVNNLPRHNLVFKIITSDSEKIDTFYPTVPQNISTLLLKK